MILVVSAAAGLTALAVWMRTTLVGRISAAGELATLGTVLVSQLRAAWNRRRAPSTSSQLGQAREALAGLVAAQWRHEATVRGLYAPDPMMVRWRVSRAELVPGDLRRLIGLAGANSAVNSGDAAKLVRWFRGLRRSRLVILGRPGAGKTSLAIMLLIGLLDGRTDGDPVPVLFTPAGWDPDTQDFLSWLAGRLAKDYPALRAADAYGLTAASDLVSGRCILPVIDGLDEIPAELRAKVISALNQAMSFDCGLILTARTTEYAATSTALLAATVIEPEPLTSEAIADYITTRLPDRASVSWQTVLRGIRRDATSPLSQILAVPWTLWLFQQVYVATCTDPAPLSDPASFPAAEAIADHLLDKLVKARIDVNSPVRSGRAEDHPFQPRWAWNPGDVRRWLGHLACYLGQLDTRDLAWWQLPRAVPRWQLKLASAAVVGLVLGPVLGPMFGFMAARVGGSPIHHTRMLFLAGFTVSIAFGLLVGTAAPTMPRPRFRPFPWMLLPGPASRLLAGASIGLVAGIATGIASKNQSTGILIGIPVGIGAGLGAGLGTGSGASPCYANFSLRNRIWPLLRGLLRGLAAGVVLGLAVGLVVGLIEATGGYGYSLVHDIVVYTRAYGFPVGIGFGLALGLLNWATSATGSARAVTPVSTLRDERRMFLFRGLAFGLMTWLIPGLVTADLLHGPSLLNRLEVGLTVGLVTGLSAGLAAGLGGAWPAYMVVRIVLATRRRLPFRLTGFLDDAYRLGILRQAGPAYQFRHAILQDHLAEAREDGHLVGRPGSSPHGDAAAAGEVGPGPQERTLVHGVGVGPGIRRWRSAGRAR